MSVLEFLPVKLINENEMKFLVIQVENTRPPNLSSQKFTGPALKLLGLGLCKSQAVLFPSWRQGLQLRLLLRVLLRQPNTLNCDDVGYLL